MIKSFDRAATFIDDVGFALLWPASRIPLPSLWAVGTIEEGFNADAERVWGWKDELPLRKKAWYGTFLRGRKSFLSRELLADLYPRDGTPDDFRSVELSPDARRMAAIVEADGPISASVLREAMKVPGPRFNKAVNELGRALVVTHFGVEDEGAGWPSACFELTTRVFKPKPRGSGEERRARAARRFVGTVIECRVGDLAGAFGWTPEQARAALDACVERGDARVEERKAHPKRWYVTATRTRTGARRRTAR